MVLAFPSKILAIPRLTSTPLPFFSVIYFTSHLLPNILFPSLNYAPITIVILNFMPFIFLWRQWDTENPPHWAHPWWSLHLLHHQAFFVFPICQCWRMDFDWSVASVAWAFVSCLSFSCVTLQVLALFSNRLNLLLLNLSTYKMLSTSFSINFGPLY